MWPESPRPKGKFEGNLVAVDPGVTTGMAFRINGKVHTLHIVGEHRAVLDLLKDAQMLVYERFATGGMLSGFGLETIELGAAIRGYCYAKGIPCYASTPQYRYSHMSRAKAYLERKYGKKITSTSLERHEVDALAHLLAWEWHNIND